MTAKQAIINRCLDCRAFKCNLDCPLFGLAKPKAGVNRIDSIRKYCQWCMNRNPVNQCVSQDCAIYQYRAKAKGNIHVDFLSMNPFINDNEKHTPPKNDANHVCKNGGASIVININFQGDKSE